LAKNQDFIFYIFSFLLVLIFFLYAVIAVCLVFLDMNINTTNNLRNERAGSEDKQQQQQRVKENSESPGRAAARGVVEIPVQHYKSTSATSMPASSASTTSTSGVGQPTPIGLSAGSRLGGFREKSPFGNQPQHHNLRTATNRGDFGAMPGGFFDNSDFFDRFDKDFGKKMHRICPFSKKRKDSFSIYR
jgi:hypothetical protein